MRTNKKLLIIQIDGLPFDVIEREIKEEKLPFFKKLLEENYSLGKIVTGLPATTSRFQAEVMYGDASEIPGMMWFSKKKSKFFYMTLQKEVKEVEKERKSKRPLLRKGVSIGNIYSGGAKINFGPSSYFGLGTKYFPRSLMLFSIFLLPFIVVLDFFFYLFTPFRRGTFTESFFGEWISRKALFKVLWQFIKEKKSPIYVTLMSYDSRSHPFGREHKWTISVLKTLEKEIEKIFKVASKEYDIFILSDHGQVDTVLFRDIYGEKLSDLISEFTGKKVINSDDIKKSMIFSSMDVKKKLKSQWQKRIFDFVYRLGRKYYQDREFKSLPFYELKEDEIIFVDQGDMAQIYFGAKGKKKMTLKEIEKFYPGLINKIFSLFEIETISFLRGKNKVEIMTKDRGLKKNKLYLSFIKELTKMRESGDIIVFGRKIGENKVVSFAPDKRSIHGGIEKGEQEGFFLFPQGAIKSKKKYFLPIDLYKFFSKSKSLT